MTIEQYYYQSSSATRDTSKVLSGIVVTVNIYPQYIFLIGEEGTIEGITTGEVPETYDKTKFESIAEFEQHHNFGTQTGANTSNQNNSITPTITTYTVTFNKNGGSSISSQQVAAGGTATRPAIDPIKQEYNFSGWYSDSELTTLYDFTNTINENTTIYAKWTEILKGATIKLLDGTTRNVITADYGRKVKYLNADGTGQMADRVWRLFYVDNEDGTVSGKGYFGDDKGSIYLKAD